LQITDTGKPLSQSISPAPAALGVGKHDAARDRSVAREGLKYAFVVWLVVRLALSAWGALIMAVAPEESHAHIYRDYPGVVLPKHDLYGYTIGLWNIYDVRQYIKIAEQGYETDPNALSSYFPGYPLLIKIASPLLLGDSLLAALVIANTCALIFFWYLYRLVQMDYDSQVARRAVLFGAIFPSSFFLFMGYTEAPLLAAIVASIYYARRGSWWLAGLLAGAAAFIKQPGIFILVPLAFIYWQQYRSNKEMWSLRQKLDWAWLLLAPLSALAYILYRYFYIAAPLVDASDMGGGQKLAIPGYPLFSAILAIRPDNSMLPFNLMDITFTLLTIALLVGVLLKVRSTPYRLFALVLAASNLSVYMYDYIFRPEANSPRRLLLIFPIFIFLALITSSRRTYRLLAYGSSALFLVMSGLFANWIFVS
jgi:hypothetical protein